MKAFIFALIIAVTLPLACFAFGGGREEVEWYMGDLGTDHGGREARQYDFRIEQLKTGKNRVLRQAGSPGNPGAQGLLGNLYKSDVGGVRHKDFSIEETDLTPLGEQLKIGNIRVLRQAGSQGNPGAPSFLVNQDNSGQSGQPGKMGAPRG